MELLTHNQITLNEVENFINKGQCCCVVNACGSGKTTIMSEFITNHKDKTFMILTKQKNARNYYIKRDKVFDNDNVQIRTYAKMYTDFITNNTADYNVDYLLVDEAHYIGANNWKKAYINIIDSYNPICVGLTATPQRFEDQGTDNTIVKEFFDDNVAGNYSAKDLQKMGVFIEPEYVLSIYNLLEYIDKKVNQVIDAPIEDSTKLKFLEKLEDVANNWKRNSCPELIFKTYLPKFMYKEHCNRILVYIENVNVLEEKRTFVDNLVKSIFPTKTVKSYDYTYKSNDGNLKKFLKEEKAIDIKILYSIDKIMETVHIDDLSIAIMLRPSVSNRIITQQFGRINSINNKHKALIIDMVDNLNNIKEFSNYATNNCLDMGISNENAIDLKLPHIIGYFKVFDIIDKGLARFEYYTYKGITGTLRDICSIYMRNITKVKELLKCGCSLQRAIELVPMQKYRHNSFYIDGDIEDYDFTLSKEEQAYAEEHYNLIEKYANRFNLDDDLTSRLTIHYLYKIHKSFKLYDTDSFQIRLNICNGLKNHSIRLLRSKYIQELTYSSIDDLEDTPIEMDIPNNIKQSEVEKLFNEVLTEKQIEVLIMRYGLNGNEPKSLEYIANIYNITRERVRQIESKAIRKLKQHGYLRLKKWFEFYN